MLAAARVLREREQADAQELLKRLVEQVPSVALEDSHAIQLAVRAEAHILLSQWKEAEGTYRQAIDLIDNTTVKRSWWFNIATVAIQLDDDLQRRTALQEALEVSNSDDIRHRALDLQRSSEPATRLRSVGTKAN
jgi:tetratricopeptide (TPR) repeat protein